MKHSESLLERNLTALKTSNLQLASQCSAAIQRNARRYSIQTSDRTELFIQTENGTNQLIDSNDISFFEKPKPISDTVQTVVVGGFGLGQFLRLQLQQGSPHVKKWIVLQPSLEDFVTVLESVDCSDLLSRKNITWMIGVDSHFLYESLFHYFQDRNNLISGRWIEMRVHPIYEALYPHYFKHFLEQWSASLELGKNSLSYFEDCFEGFKNTIQNLSWIQRTPGLHPFVDIFKERPAVVISTGPSLHKAIPHLKRIKDRAILFAADASLKILHKAEIIPHFVFCLERDEGSKPFFESLDPKLCLTRLISFPLVPQSVIGAYPGPSISVYRNYGYFSYLENSCPRGIIKCGPSVAHMATTTADIMGCNPIVLVGQDLSYDPQSLASHPEGISYADWAKPQTLEAIEKKLKASNDQLLWVPGNLQDKVPTNATWEVFRQVFASQLHHHRSKLFNGTMGGAQIPGIEWIRFEEWAESLKKSFSSWSEINQLIQSAEKKSPQLTPSLEIFRSQLIQIQSQVKKVQSLEDILAIQFSENYLMTLSHFMGKRDIEILWMDNPAKIIEIWPHEILGLIEKLDTALTSRHNTSTMDHARAP